MLSWRWCPGTERVRFLVVTRILSWRRRRRLWLSRPRGRWLPGNGRLHSLSTVEVLGILKDSVGEVEHAMWSSAEVFRPRAVVLKKILLRFWDVEISSSDAAVCQKCV